MSERWLTSDLPPGSLVIERYEYETRNGTKGVQWLAQIVDAEQNLLLVEVCKTRREALEVAGRAPAYTPARSAAGLGAGADR